MSNRINYVNYVAEDHNGRVHKNRHLAVHADNWVHAMNILLAQCKRECVTLVAITGKYNKLGEEPHV